MPKARTKPLRSHNPHEVVNHPPHYFAEDGTEAIDVIEAFYSDNYLRGSALKYLLRAGRKADAATDLRKCIFFIERELEKVTS